MERKGSGLVRASAHNKTGRTAFVLVLLAALLVAIAFSFATIGTAAGLGEADSSTLGIGANRSTLNAQDQAFDAVEKLGIAVAADAQDQAIVVPIKRSVSQEVPSPVVELVAVDLGDEATMKAAAQYGVLNPPKEAKRLSLNTSGEGWQVGQASGYDVDSSSTLTRSGRAFDDNCVTVAVPEGMEDLLGHPVVIVYDNMVVIATVTDTGGFAKYGRALDLGGGVFKAFGYDDIWEWGVREVHYKFL